MSQLYRFYCKHCGFPQGEPEPLYAFEKEKIRDFCLTCGSVRTFELREEDA